MGRTGDRGRDHPPLVGAGLPARPSVVGDRRLPPAAVPRSVPQRSQPHRHRVAGRDRQSLPAAPSQIGLARNVTMLRTVGWMVARMATINLDSDPFIARKLVRFRRWLEEATITPLSTPTTLTDDDVRGPDMP